MGWKKGQSGNPGGRKKELKEITELAKEASPAAFEQIQDLSQNCKDPRVRLSASQYILDRAWGKPAQAVEVSGKDGKDLTINVNIIQKQVRGG